MSGRGYRSLAWPLRFVIASHALWAVSAGACSFALARLAPGRCSGGDAFWRAVYELASSIELVAYLLVLVAWMRFSWRLHLNLESFGRRTKMGRVVGSIGWVVPVFGSWMVLPFLFEARRSSRVDPRRASVPIDVLLGCFMWFASSLVAIGSISTCGPIATVVWLADGLGIVAALAGTHCAIAVHGGQLQLAGDAPPTTF